MSLRGSTNGQVSAFFKDAAAPSPLKTKPKLYPFSLRFSEEEREWLLRRAGTLSLAAYIRLQLFKDFENAPSPRRKASHKVGTPSAELAVLGKMLGSLGQSQFASNLNRIAKQIKGRYLSPRRLKRNCLKPVRPFRICVLLSLQHWG